MSGRFARFLQKAVPCPLTAPARGRHSFLYPALLEKWSFRPLIPSQGRFCRHLKATAADQFLPIFPCIGKKSNKGKSSQLNGCPQRSSSPFCLCPSAQQLCVCWRGRGLGQRPGITLLPVNFLAGHLLKSLTSVLHLPHL